MKRGFYKPRERKGGKHSLRLVKEVKVKTAHVKEIYSQLQKQGTTVWVGWAGNDFDNNMMTLRQYVRIPRIFNLTTN